MLTAILLVVILIAIPWACSLSGVVTPAGSAVVNSVPAIRSSVTDFAGVLSEPDKEYLRSLCMQLEKKTSAELAIVVVKHMSGDGISDNTSSYPSVDDYANELFKKNKFGKRDKNNGVLFLVSTGERKTRIEVGYGLEGVLPDGKCGRILDTFALPYFKDGHYAEGIKKTTEAIVKTLDPAERSGDPLPAVSDTATVKTGDSSLKGKGANTQNKSGNDTLYYLPALILSFIPVWILFILLVICVFLLVFSGLSSSTLSYFFVLLAIALFLKFFSLFGWFGGSSGGGSSGGGFGGGSSGGGGAGRGF